MNGQPAPVPGEAGDRHGEQAEREPEEQQRDCALVQILRPQQAEPGPGDEQRERPGERPELLRPVVAADQLPAEQHRGTGDHGVERDEQVRVGRADVHRDPRRDAGQRRDGDQPRPAAEERGDRDRADRADDDGRRVDLRVPAGGEVGGEKRAAERASRPARRAAGRGGARRSRARARRQRPGRPRGRGRPSPRAHDQRRGVGVAGNGHDQPVAPRLRAARGGRAARAPPCPLRAPSRQRTRRSAETRTPKRVPAFASDRVARELDVAHRRHRTTLPLETLPARSSAPSQTR